MSDGLDAFWAVVEQQLDQLKTAKTADDVIRICPATPGISSGDGFFGGSGGDASVEGALHEAGWTHIWREAHYHWAMHAPGDGGAITYVEGDLYKGNQPPV